MSALIEFQGFNKFFGEAQVLKGIDLSVQRGEVVVILGPSGCGKSTLLRCLNGLEVAHSGSLRFAGKELLDKTIDWRQVRQDIGMVFQSYHLFPHMSVLDNILLGPLKVQKRDPGRPVSRRKNCWSAWALPTSATPSHASFPAASSNASPSSARCA